MSFGWRSCKHSTALGHPDSVKYIGDLAQSYSAVLQGGISYTVYGDHLAWPLVVGALLVIAKRGAQPQTLAKLTGANCAGPMGNLEPLSYVLLGFYAGLKPPLFKSRLSSLCEHFPPPQVGRAGCFCPCGSAGMHFKALVLYVSTSHHPKLVGQVASVLVGQLECTSKP
jgi:hypothetical protein